MESTYSFGLAHLWAQSDIAIRSVALILLLMSIMSWYLILKRALRQLRTRHDSDAIEAFWSASNLSEGLNCLNQYAAASPISALAQQAASAADHLKRHTQHNTLGGNMNREEFLTRAMRKSITLSTARLESGLTILASVGSTAPFIGLFGTVWGIYHALVNIAASGMATLDKVAGPVGEALIMTAFGLFVAIPAVLAYNTFTRINRVELSELDAFAYDLHAWFCTGARLNSQTESSSPERAPSAPNLNQLAGYGAAS